MSPICHIEAAPRVPGCEPRGKRPHDYGRGRVCALPGCTTILRRTHKGPICDPCINDAKARSRASACGPPASPPAARATKEEKVGKEDRREDVLLVFAHNPSRCFNAHDVCVASRIRPSCVYKHLKALVASGDLVKDGPGVYRWPKTEDARTAPAPLPAPAPSTSGEQPANQAPAPAPETPLEPVPAAALRPFAGIVTTTCIGYSMSGELRILDNLEQLDDATRERVLRYAFARWPGKLDIVREVEVRYPTPDKVVIEILDTLDRYARTAP